MLTSKVSRVALACYISSIKLISSAVVELWSSKVKLYLIHVCAMPCHAPTGIMHTGMTE